MKSSRLGVQLGVAAIAASFFLLPTPAAAETFACDEAVESGQIWASELDEVANCTDLGDLIIRDDASGVGAVLPERGTSVTYSATSAEPGVEVPEFTVAQSEDGEIATLSMTHDAVEIQGSPSVAAEFSLAENPVFDPVVTPLATSPKCDSYAYSISNERWLSTAKWWYKTPSFGGQARVAGAFTAMADGIGACGQNKPNSAAHAYQGTTSTSANINDSLCLANDLKNVVDGGPLSSGTLAGTCTWRTSGQIINADIRIDTSSRSWYTGSSVTGCSGAYDLQGVMTHEAGHFFGLNHVALATQQVMMPESPTCLTSQRKLGNGDLAGMKARYP